MKTIVTKTNIPERSDLPENTVVVQIGLQNDRNWVDAEAFSTSFSPDEDMVATIISCDKIVAWSSNPIPFRGMSWRGASCWPSHVWRPEQGVFQMLSKEELAEMR